ncbi:hypothetical protein GGS26DRAFT_574364 [Hypomontagnella submonticulosa]|nr:hypothetical protein GGS26DRAFT_574364 [Hypomontagnella submonticulosa]
MSDTDFGAGSRRHILHGRLPAQYLTPHYSWSLSHGRHISLSGTCTSNTVQLYNLWSMRSCRLFEPIGPRPAPRVTRGARWSSAWKRSRTPTRGRASARRRSTTRKRTNSKRIRHREPTRWVHVPDSIEPAEWVSHSKITASTKWPHGLGAGSGHRTILDIQSRTVLVVATIEAHRRSQRTLRQRLTREPSTLRIHHQCIRTAVLDPSSTERVKTLKTKERYTWSSIASSKHIVCHTISGT